MDKFEIKRKARFNKIREEQRKRRGEVVALARIYPQIEVARRMGISRQRVSRIVKTGDSDQYDLAMSKLRETAKA